MNPHSSSGSFPDGFPGAGSSPSPFSPHPYDIDLVQRVATRLSALVVHPGTHIVVEVQNQVVILEGFVPTVELRSLTHQIVWETQGVADVCNELIAWDDESPQQAPGRC
jgi:osmotically-inducible protein OsmY